MENKSRETGRTPQEMLSVRFFIFCGTFCFWEWQVYGMLWKTALSKAKEISA